METGSWWWINGRHRHQSTNPKATPSLSVCLCIPKAVIQRRTTYLPQFRSLIPNVAAASFGMMVVIAAANLPGWSGEGQDLQGALKSVEAFCSAEFDGKYQKERLDLFALSQRESRRREKARDGDPVAVEVVDFRSDPVDIVKAFKVTNLSLEAGTGQAEVEYTLLGSLRAPKGANLLEATQVIKAARSSRRVTLRLAWTGTPKRWLVIDPPIPKVSREGILRIKNEFLNRVRKTLEANPGEPLPHLEAAAKRLTGKIQAIEAL